MTVSRLLLSHCLGTKNPTIHCHVGLGSVIGAGLDKFGKVVQPTEAWERLCMAYDALLPREHCLASLALSSGFGLNCMQDLILQYPPTCMRSHHQRSGSDSPAVGLAGAGVMERLVDLLLVICSQMSSSSPQQQDPAHTDFKEGVSAVVKVGGAVPRNGASDKHQQRGEAKGFGKSISAHGMSWTNGTGSRQAYVSLYAGKLSRQAQDPKRKIYNSQVKKSTFYGACWYHISAGEQINGKLITSGRYLSSTAFMVAENIMLPQGITALCGT
ncbi:hypothetical protein B0H19DRAFT_1067404 [Mycena capillaripes]|nr:hypothetical protein B0H19DRAFT_1067404 [Mycena capillaripes]